IAGNEGLRQLCRLPLFLHLTVAVFERTRAENDLLDHSIDENSVIELYLSSGLEHANEKLPAEALTFLGNIVAFLAGRHTTLIHTGFSVNRRVGECWPDNTRLNVASEDSMEDLCNYSDELDRIWQLERQGSLKGRLQAKWGRFILAQESN